MSKPRRIAIISAGSASIHEHIVVTHGTDSMVETARALHAIPGKTIPLSGAMQPAKFRTTDEVFNIGTAIGAVSCLPIGVYLTMNGRDVQLQRTQKS